MCGIAGLVIPGGIAEDLATSRAEKMSRVIRHRGPDEAGAWFDVTSGVVLCHRRLSILDLSRAGSQPVVSRSGRLVMVFNGEIYNHQALRKRCIGQDGTAIQWRGRSDTETLVEIIDQVGLESALNLCEGMFALAVWNRQERTLSLARDRMGEKPLYYGWHSGRFYFGSELKALLACPEFRPSIDPESVQELLTWGYVNAPFSIYSGIQKVVPGTFVVLAPDQADREPKSKVYWSIAESIRDEALSTPLEGSEEHLSRLHQALRSSVRHQMLSDVPLGAFLSGGIDSSLITALMQECTGAPIRTFTVGFEEEQFDESPHARAIAGYLHTDHSELRVSSKDAQGVIPDLPAIFDEPIGDPSQIPTFLVSRLAEKDVKVALTGDGADELFGGYTRYQKVIRRWGQMRSVPSWMRAPLSRGAVGAMSLLGSPFRSSAFVGSRAERIGRVADYFGAGSVHEMGAMHVNRLVGVSQAGACNQRGPRAMHQEFTGVESPLSVLLLQDLLTYLPGNLLVKVDRASMSTSLECRAPFLDVGVMRCAFGLPDELKIRSGESKWALKQILSKYLPKELFERPKMGFAVPVDQWIRGPLRPWAEELLHPDSLVANEVPMMDLITRRWGQHLAGKVNYRDFLWGVLMYQAWRKEVPH